jgi:hypothetical protein
MSVNLSIIKGADSAHTITGNDTYELKEAIKSCGGKWTPLTRSWVVPAHRSLVPLEAAIQKLKDQRIAEAEAKQTADEEFKKAAEALAGRALAKAELKAKRAAAKLEKAKAAEKERVKACLAEKAKSGAYHWICCEKCEVVDWYKQHTYCWDCGVDKGLYRDCFRVRGSIYTGD